MSVADDAQKIASERRTTHENRRKTIFVRACFPSPFYARFGPQNRPKIDLGATLVPKMGARGSKRASETEFGRFLIDLGPNFDRFWTDLGPNLDRFAITFLPTISSQCKLLKHMFKGIAEAFSE